MSPRLDLVLDAEHAQYRPGDSVRGHVAVLEGGKSRELSVAIRYREATDDYSATVVELSSGPLHQGDLEAGRSYDFAIQLPPDALPAYRSEHGALYWEIEAKSDEFGIDTKSELSLDVQAEAPAAAPT